MQDLLHKIRSLPNYIRMSFAPQCLNIMCQPWTQLALHNAQNLHPLPATKKFKIITRCLKDHISLFYCSFTILNSIPTATSGYIHQNLQKIMSGDHEWTRVLFSCPKYEVPVKERGYVMHLSYPAKSANVHGPVGTLTTAAIPETQVIFTAFSSQRVSTGTPHHLKLASLQLLTCFPT